MEVLKAFFARLWLLSVALMLTCNYYTIHSLIRHEWLYAVLAGVAAFFYGECADAGWKAHRKKASR